MNRAMLIDKATLIERWEQTLRVLENLSEHERRHHFDMGTWASKTKCGTVACIAGHCAMDPWFNGQGLRLAKIKWVGLFDSKEFRLEPCADDFWGEDCDSIFLSSQICSVDEAIVAVRRVLEINKNTDEYVPPDETDIDLVVEAFRAAKWRKVELELNQCVA